MTQNVSLAIDPLLAWPIILALAVPALALVLWALMTRTRGAWVRLAALSALALALINPMLLREDVVSEPATVAVIVDESQSQRLGARTVDTEAALETVIENLERHGEFDMRVARVASAGDDGPNAQTALFETLRATLSDVAPARIGGAIIISDGQIHDVPSDAQELGFNAPIHGLITGSDDEFDRRVEIVQAPRFSIINQDLTINYRVVENGRTGAADTPLNVDIRRNGELIAQETVTRGDDFPITLQLDRAGKNIIEIEVEADETELTDTNNRAVLRIEGIRENLRVLLVSGEPHSGERAWRNLLKADASVDLVHFTILRPPEKQDGTPINELSLTAFPTRELFVEKIEDFDLIVFDRYQNRNVLPLLYYDYISQYVRDGGALLIAAGPEYAGPGTIADTPLGTALPALPVGAVTQQAFRPAITDAGKRHPVTRNLGADENARDWGRWFRLIDVAETDGTVVMQGANDKPLLILERFGEGRVGLMLSDHGWLWARGFEGGGPYLDLYRRTAHWLMREPDLEEETLSAEGSGNRLTITRQTMADEAGIATVTTPSGTTRDVVLTKVSPGLFEADLDIDEIGLYRIVNDDLTALASVGPVDAPEFRDMISTTQRMESVADDTGGTVRRLRNGSAGLSIPNIVPVRAAGTASGRDWIGLNRSEQSRIVGVDREPLFAGFLGLALMLMAMGSTWWREGR